MCKKVGLLSLGCYNKNTIDWVAYTKQKFIPHKPGIWKFKYRMLTWLDSDESLFSGSRLLTCILACLRAERRSTLSSDFCVRALIPLMRDPSTWPHHSLITCQSPLHSIISRGRALRCSFLGDKHSIYRKNNECCEELNQ